MAEYTEKTTWKYLRFSKGVITVKLDVIPSALAGPSISKFTDLGIGLTYQHILKSHGDAVQRCLWPTKLLHLLFIPLSGKKGWECACLPTSLRVSSKKRLSYFCIISTITVFNTFNRNMRWVPTLQQQDGAQLIKWALSPLILSPSLWRVHHRTSALCRWRALALGRAKWPS